MLRVHFKNVADHDLQHRFRVIEKGGGGLGFEFSLENQAQSQYNRPFAGE